MYRESGEPLEKPVESSFWERLGAWWVNLKKRWPEERIIALSVLSVIISLFALMTSISLERGSCCHTVAKVFLYIAAVSIAPVTISIIILSCWALTALFSFVIRGK